ncbi:MAG: phosphatidate cytidylyltransferase [Clostridia bacterium]|nr:phosphatidate cytidylyltransferase [Clostridia bacterium]
MLKRTITGLIIAGIWVLFFVLKATFSNVIIISTAVSKHPVDLGTLIFDFLLLIMGSLGANEILRVFEKKIIRPHRVLTVLYPIILFPIMSLFGVEWAVVITILAMLVVLAVSVPYYEDVTIEGIGLTFLSMVYPSGLLVCLVAVNHLAPFSALVLAFAVSPAADVMAYFVGSLFKGKKLCPNISPNKTISGAIGGLLGGIIAAILVCLVLHPASEHIFKHYWQEILAYGVVGFLGSLLTELGDLVESLMKRKLDIKDMGRLLPGHGGVMDRIDGLLFASPLVAFLFCAVLPMLAV